MTQTFQPTINIHAAPGPPFKTTFQAAQERNTLNSEASEEHKLAQLEKELHRLIGDMKLIHSSKLDECTEQVLKVIEDIKGFFTNFTEIRNLNLRILKPFYSNDFRSNLNAGARVYWNETPQLLEEGEDFDVVSDPCETLVGSLVKSLLELRVRPTRTMKDYEDSLLHSEETVKQVAALERYLKRLQDQDATIASATGSIPPLVSGELKRLFDEINQSCPALLEPFQGHGNPVVLRSQISTAVGRVSARIDTSKRG